jgi:GNAT superfamily N-acetyltransferase
MQEQEQAKQQGSAAAVIRRARPEEAAAIGALAMRSKAHWGYDEAFLELSREALSPTTDYIREMPVYVVDEAGELRGFYGMSREEGEWALEFLFIDPAAIGHGYGRQLFEHLVATVKEMGVERFMIDADPFAEEFYKKMGAVRIGEVKSTAIEGRYLPLMEYVVSERRGLWGRILGKK